MTYYFRTPFAELGQRVAVPENPQAGGTVNYTEGYGPDYERDQVQDPSAKDVPRQSHNQLNFNMTEAIQEMQQSGVLAYRNDVNYPVDGYCIGSDNYLYKALVENGPDSTPVDPVGNPSEWFQTILGREVGFSDGNLFEQTPNGLGGHGYGGTSSKYYSDIDAALKESGFGFTDALSVGDFPSGASQDGVIFIKSHNGVFRSETYTPVSGSLVNQTFSRVFNGSIYTSWELLLSNDSSQVPIAWGSYNDNYVLQQNFGISSVATTGTGQALVTMSVPLAVNYSVVSCGLSPNAASTIYIASPNTYTSTTFIITIAGFSGTRVDQGSSFVIFGSVL